MAAISKSYGSAKILLQNIFIMRDECRLLIKVCLWAFALLLLLVSLYRNRCGGKFKETMPLLSFYARKKKVHKFKIIYLCSEDRQITKQLKF